MQRVLLVAVSLVLSGGGCLVAPIASRGHPLYPEPGGQLPVSQVARLSTLLPGGSSPTGGATSSFIKAVDGQAVTRLASAFELLPGCHVVETESRLVVSGMNVTATMEVPTRIFVFHMKPGYEYLVVVEMSEPASGIVRMAVYGAEQDPAGARTGAIAPVTPAAAVQACKNSGKG